LLRQAQHTAKEEVVSGIIKKLAKFRVDGIGVDFLGVFDVFPGGDYAAGV
jgi:hypothetical protein